MRLTLPPGAIALLKDPVWVGLAAALLGWLLIQPAYWRQLELKLFDWLVVTSAPNQVPLPITIVGIDEATFDTLKSSWPLPRRHHARLLDNLREAGVAVVGFDIVVADASEPEDDRPFAAAIRRFGHVVLASDLTFREDTTMRQWFRVDPHPAFLKEGALQGYSSLQVDDDAVLRRVPTVQDAFWRAVLYKFDQARPGVVTSLDVSGDMRIRYLGGPHTFTYIPYHQLLEPDKHMPPSWRDFLKDNIVLVGRKVSVIGDVGAAQGEMYQTPFYFRTREFMPRVEAHANIIANMVMGNALREAPPGWPLGAWISAVFIGVAFMRRWHPLRSGIVLAALAGTLAALEYGMFQFRGTWLPVAGAVMTVALIYVLQGTVAFVAEQRKRREVRDAFSRYVSPELVDQVIANPGLLKLGGDRRQLTIIFSDLAGFTTISEQLDPEKVSAIVNRHLSEMTDAILEHHGTVDKFLGDGIMAFWGAPLPDERQSERAVQATIEMQRRMASLREEVQRETGTELRMRIGVNRGECIIGNMGGDKRFDYTAVGDSVNLASRIEGVNKIYGTEILVSAAAVGAISNGVHFREVDTVRVKGKHVGITVYTPCEDRDLIALSTEALAAYRAGKFDAAEAVLKRVLEHQPDDPIAMVFLERIAGFREDGLPPDWDSITTLDSK